MPAASFNKNVLMMIIFYRNTLNFSVNIFVTPLPIMVWLSFTIHILHIEKLTADDNFLRLMEESNLAWKIGTDI